MGNTIRLSLESTGYSRSALTEAWEVSVVLTWLFLQPGSAPPMTVLEVLPSQYMVLGCEDIWRLETEQTTKCDILSRWHMEAQVSVHISGQY